MRAWLLGMVLILAAGCGTNITEQNSRAASMTPQTTYTAEMNYQAACRAILAAVRQQWGDNGVGHDVWTDIEEASVFWGNPDARNAKFVIKINADGVTRSEISIAAKEPYYLEKVAGIVGAAIAEPKKKP